ncbi:DNA helicase [Streptococcus ruminantium]|uniref:DNA helicase n=1 Tax=Streptococcus ruminantium TaxID=1917441 RepID=A0A2Z5TM57_9STRE|nr:DNA helicase [Streptococcus ruminantium]
MEKIKKIILIDGEDKTGRIESIQLVRHKGKSCILMQL